MGLALGLLIAYIISLSGGITILNFFYTSNVYQADVAKDWLQSAQTQTNLGNINNSIDKAINILKNYHGNPSIYYSPMGDYDIIRNKLIEIKQNNLQLPTVNAMPTQQAVQNMRESLKMQKEQLADVGSNWLWNPHISPYLYFFVYIMLLPLPTWAVVIIVEEKASKRRLAAYERSR